MAGHRGAHTPLRYQLVERRLLAMIENGTLGPGQRAPSLRQVATALGVSLATVGQAYAGLEERGMLEARPRSGFFVRETVAGPPPAGSPAPEPPTARPVRRGELVRRVMDTMGREGVLPLGVAQVDPELLPGKALARLLAEAARRAPGRCANYAAVAGCPELRAQAARRLALAGVAADPREIVTTCGAMEGLSIALRALTRPGDTVLIAAPAYHFFLQMLEVLGLRVVEVPSHPIEGVRPAEVAEVLDRIGVAACVLSPTWNNPDGSLVPDAAKRELVRLLSARGVPLVEDDVYGDVSFASPRPPACKAFDEDGTVTLASSFSKALAPGYRAGYLLPGRAVGERALELKAMTTLAAATPTELAVAAYLERGLYERHLARLNRTLEAQVETMRLAVARHFPEGTRATNPRGGFMLWIELPEGGPSGTELFLRAAAEGIGISPGMLFSVTGRFERFARLNCGLRFTPEVRRAVERLGALARG